MLLRPAMLDHKQTLAYVAAHLARILAVRIRDALAPLGLMPAQFTAIAEIAQDEGLTQKQLVQRLDLEQPGVARTLTTMEKDGWIERRFNERGQGLYLTERSRAVLEPALAAVDAVNREAMREMGRSERALLVESIADAVEVARQRA